MTSITGGVGVLLTPGFKPAKYRSQLRIYVDIMRVIRREGQRAKRTRILSAANLSYARVVRYLEEMKALDVVKETERAYRLTQKGVEFMNDFEKLEEFTESFGFKL